MTRLPVRTAQRYALWRRGVGGGDGGFVLSAGQWEGREATLDADTRKSYVATTVAPPSGKEWRACRTASLAAISGTEANFLATSGGTFVEMPLNTGTYSWTSAGTFAAGQTGYVRMVYTDIGGANPVWATDYKSFVASNVPAQMGSADWLIAAADGGATITLVNAADGRGRPITGYEYQIDGGAWGTLPGATTLGARFVAVLGTAEVDIAIRAKNINGDGPASVSKPVTPLEATVKFGALTRAGHGDFPAPAGATSITGGTATGYTLSGGVLTATSSGSATAGTLTFNVGDPIVITTIPNAYSVANMTQLIAVANLAGLALGQEILLRDGDYNAAKADSRFQRTASPTGAWNGSNYVLVRSENYRMATIHRLTIQDSGCQNYYFHFYGLGLNHDGTGASQECAITTLGGISFVKVSNCLGEGTPNPARIRPTDLQNGVAFFTVGCSDIIIEDNEFYDCVRPIAVQGANCIIRRNYVRRYWGDGIQSFYPHNNLLVEGNDFSDKLSDRLIKTITDVVEGATTAVTVTDATGVGPTDYARFVGVTGLDEIELVEYVVLSVVGNVITINANSSGATPWVSGGELWTTAAHADGIQISCLNAVDGEVDDITIRANRFTSGNGTLYMSDLQPIWISEVGAGVKVRRLLIEGNICEGRMGNGITVPNAEESSIRYNTMVKQLGHDYISFVPLIQLTGTVGANVAVHDNVGNGFAIAGAQWNVNNYVIPYTGAAYAAAFVSPGTGISTTVAEVDYAPKAGGPIALTSPVIPGALPHQSFVPPFNITWPGRNRDNPTVPDAFVLANWGLADPTTGGTLNIVINSLPFDGFDRLTDVEFRVDGGAWNSSGGVTSFSILGLTNGVEHDIELRAVNATGAGLPSDLKSGTPTLNNLPILVGSVAANDLGNAGAGSTTVSLTSLVGGIGSVALQGDIVIAVIAVSDAVNRNPDITSPTDYAESAVITSTDTNTIAAKIGSKIMGSTPDTSVTLSQTSASAGARIVMVQVYRNVDPADPFGGLGILTATAANSTAIDPPSITPAFTGSLIVAGGAASHNNGATTISAPYLSGTVTREQLNTNNDITGLMGSVAWPGGAYNPAAFTLSATNAANSWFAFTCALKPKP
jgi:hypothetical protein